MVVGAKPPPDGFVAQGISIRNPDGVSRGVIAALLEGEPQPFSLGRAHLKLTVDNGARTIVVTLGQVVAT